MLRRCANLLRRRPEIVNLERFGFGEQRALHIAVLRRDAAMASLLLEHGADARIGMYPNRDATSALTIATERGYDEIVAMIREQEKRREASRAATEAEGPQTPQRDGPLTAAVQSDRLDLLTQLLDQGYDPDERTRVEGIEEIVYSWSAPLHHCAGTGKLEMAKLLLERGADPNGQVYACGSPTYVAYRRKDRAMIELLERFGGAIDAASVGYLRLTEVARRMLTGEIDPRLEFGMFSGATAAEQILWSGASGGEPEIVRMALDKVDWPRDDPRWFWMLWRPLPGHWVRPAAERAGFLECFRLILERCDPNVRAQQFGQTMLHEVIARDHEEGVGFATLLLNAGTRMDVRDQLLRSTPLGWACRWGRVGLVALLLERGADPVEADAEPWATPRAWAEKMNHTDVAALLPQALR